MADSAFWWIAICVIASGTPFGSCGYPGVPAAVVEPSVIGVIEAVERTDERGGYVYTLADGATVGWPAEGEHLDGPMSPDEGDLLIYGEAPLGNGATPWRAAAPDEGGCYRLSVDGAIRDSAMALTLGFSLPIADSFDDVGANQQFLNVPGGYFCLDETGHVTSATAVGRH